MFGQWWRKLRSGKSKKARRAGTAYSRRRFYHPFCEVLEDRLAPSRNTLTALAVPPGPLVFGQADTLAASVSAVSPDTGVPTGVVTFEDGSSMLGTMALSGGTASLSTTSLTLGNHTISAVYGGDADFDGSTSDAFAQTVGQASTTTTVTSLANPTVFGQSATFTATVNAVTPGSGTPTGTVTFLDSGSMLGTSNFFSGSNAASDFSPTSNPNGLWSYGWTQTLGSTFILDTYHAVSSVGGDNWFPSISSPAPVVGHNGTGHAISGAYSNILEPGQLGLHPGSDGADSVVRWTAPLTETVSLAASFTGVDFVGPTSTDVHVLKNNVPIYDGAVNGFGPSSAADFAQTLSVSAGDTIDFVVGYGADGSYSYDATGLDATITPLATQTLATYTTSDLPAGMHTVTATYSGDSNFSASTSGPFNHTVNLANTTTIVTSSVNHALDFDGQDDYVQLPSGLIHDRTTLTLETWFNTTGTGVIFGYQNRDYQTNPSSYVPILYVGTDGRLRGEFWNGSVNQVTTSSAVNDGMWHHVALVGNNDTQSLYLDGVLVGTVAGTINHVDMTANQVGIGYTAGWPNTTGSWFPFSGLIDELRIWNVALSQADIQANMNQTLTGNEPDLVAYYRFDEGTGGTAHDLTANHNDGILGGGVVLASLCGSPRPPRCPPARGYLAKA